MIYRIVTRAVNIDYSYYIHMGKREVKNKWRGWVKMFIPPVILFLYHKNKTYISPRVLPEKIQKQMNEGKELNLNLCSGPAILDDYLNLDISSSADIIIDLESELLPFSDNSVNSVICMSAINYFSKHRALQIIKDIHRVLKPGGVTRFGVQDLEVLTRKYLEKDVDFYFQKLPDGQVRFPGETFCDKFNHFFYGFKSLEDKHCKYVYAYEALKLLFEDAGFSQVYEKSYQESDYLDVKEIDNRPEQMFYLEAVKTSGARQLCIEADILWDSGNKEKAWQFYLKSIDVDSSDKNTVLKILDILLEMGQLEFAKSLLSKYLNTVSIDQEIQEKHDSLCEKIKLKKLSSAEKNKRKKKIDILDNHINTILSDRVHLNECMAWLLKASSSSNDEGVSSYYDVVNEAWDASYPETTGYIISTFICYSKLTGDDTYLEKAIQMGEWEIKIQSVEGGAGEPVGVFLPRPRIFNTGQVMLGWLALYKETGDKKYLDALIKSSDFLIRNINHKGEWINYTFTGYSKTYKSRVVWALLEVYEITRDTRYKNAAELAIDWILQQAKSNGWFYNTGFSKSPPITHLTGYTLVGLLEIYRLKNASIDHDSLMKLLTAAADNIVNLYRNNKNTSYYGLPGTLNSRWQSKDNWSCNTGNVQISFFLRMLFQFTNNKSYLLVADKLLDDAKKVHLVDGIVDENLRGGLFGSSPIGGEYCPYQIPNWGVKFFADALLQKMSSSSELHYLS